MIIFNHIILNKLNLKFYLVFLFNNTKLFFFKLTKKIIIFLLEYNKINLNFNS